MNDMDHAPPRIGERVLKCTTHKKYGAIRHTLPLSGSLDSKLIRAPLSSQRDATGIAALRRAIREIILAQLVVVLGGSRSIAEAVHAESVWD